MLRQKNRGWLTWAWVAHRAPQGCNQSAV